MADDNTSNFAGGATTGIVVTCILDEGAPTLVTRSYDATGDYQTTFSWASELYENNYVALSNDTNVLYDVCEGAPVVELPVNTETLVIGKIVSTPRLLNTPSADADADTLAERLSGKYYRYANVELMGGITAVKKATVMCDGSNATVQGVGTTLVFNITSGDGDGDGLQFDSSASNGVGVIPMHAIPTGTDGDTYSCLVGITGLMYAYTGA